jgi:hypothetical protein
MYSSESRYWYLVQFPLGEDFAEANLLQKASPNGIAKMGSSEISIFSEIQGSAGGHDNSKRVEKPFKNFAP